MDFELPHRSPNFWPNLPEKTTRSGATRTLPPARPNGRSTAPGGRLSRFDAGAEPCRAGTAHVLLPGSPSRRSSQALGRASRKARRGDKEPRDKFLKTATLIGTPPNKDTLSPRQAVPSTVGGPFPLWALTGERWGKSLAEQRRAVVRAALEKPLASTTTPLRTLERSGGRQGKGPWKEEEPAAA
ncbi:uncharacterized protein LOC144077298 [Stigmatopora argus]